ncbi:hypothetical protein B0J13DRAFT_545695, partial [Dactylonectria estremocensis]
MDRMPCLIVCPVPAGAAFDCLLFVRSTRRTVEFLLESPIHCSAPCTSTLMESLHALALTAPSASPPGGHPRPGWGGRGHRGRVLLFCPPC